MVDDEERIIRAMCMAMRNASRQRLGFDYEEQARLIRSAVTAMLDEQDAISEEISQVAADDAHGRYWGQD